MWVYTVSEPDNYPRPGKYQAVGVRFHRKDCPFLDLGRLKKTRRYSLKKLLADFPSLVSPCRRCFKDAPPILKTAHEPCPENCQPSVTILRPCAHNGGVSVKVTRRDGVEFTRWAWPENAWRFQK